MPRLLTLVAVALAPSHALVAHAPAMRPMAAVAPAGRAPASPTMLLGSRTFTKMIRSARLPSSFGPTGGRGGIIRGSDGGEGGPPPSDGASASSSDDDSSQSALTQAWKRYESLLDEKPLLMKALTSLVGFALGDTLAQLFIQKTDPFDFARLARLASFGFLVHGTTSHWFYGMLDGKIPGKSAKVVFSKVFIDQVLWNPIFGVMFFSYVGLMEAKGVAHVVDKVKNDLLTSVTGSWKVWPLAHTINFRFIPSNQRVLYINTIQIGYNCFLSIISNRDTAKA